MRILRVKPNNCGKLRRAMTAIRHMVALLVLVSSAGWGAPGGAAARANTPEAQEVLGTWYRLVLELVRHTPTYSPPVASRAFAYVGVAAFEAVATGSDTLQSLAGQLNGLQAVPKRAAGQTYDDAVVVQAAVASVVQDLFSNTGPTGQRVMASLAARLRSAVAQSVPADVVARSEAHGRSVAEHILAWSRDSGRTTRCCRRRLPVTGSRSPCRSSSGTRRN